jgi:hypothetical protein
MKLVTSLRSQPGHGPGEGPLLTRITPVLALGLLLALPASALVVASQAGNDSPPADDPGFDNVGTLSVYTGVYLGEGWVITARHAGLYDVIFGGVTYPRVPDSEVIIEHDATNDADLRMYQVDPWPDLPPLAIRSDPIPDPGTAMTDVVMIGNGWAAGDPVITEPGPGNDCAGNPPSPCGFYWNLVGPPYKIIRWGTNRIQALEPDLVVGGITTESFATAFDRNLPTPHEAQVANGDSGAAVFIKNGGSWELAGILHARTAFGPTHSAVYGDRSFAADLSFYRDQIMAVLKPACSNESDDDGDGFCDTASGFCNDGSTPGDPGCRNPDWHTESPECDDGIDNDDDGAIDTLDTTCGNAWQISETPTAGCGIGAELALLVPPLLWLRRCRRHRVA